MQSTQHMRTNLNESGCYRLTGDTPGDWELSVMGAELDRVSDDIDRLLQQVLLLQCDEETLNAWEQWLRPQRSSAGIAHRTKMLRQRFSVRPTVSKLPAYALLLSGGAAGVLTESDAGLSVLCGGFCGLTEQEVTKELDALLPAHLPWQVVSVKNWQTIDYAEHSFAHWDARKLSWSELDALTKEEIEEE